MEPGGKMGGVIFAPEVNCYKCPIGHTYPGCGIACAEYVEHMISNESDVAAVIVEPVVGTNGVLVPPKEYMPRLRQICDAHGVLLIADEVMTGWCRTGKWFAMDHWNVVPDILTTAKGITNAAIPLGLCATTQEIAAFFEDHFFSHGHTYEAHPITLAPGIAAIHEMQRLKLAERAAEMGAYLGEKLKGIKARHRSIGEVRGLGLFWGVELVKNQEKKNPFNTGEDKIAGKPLVVDRVAAKMMAAGVFIQAWMSHFVIAPPLIISREEIDLGVAALDEALGLADAEADA
jgi:taurine--2-oxoglutarate transaminase